MTHQEKKTLLILASTFPRWSDDKEPRFVYDLCLGLKDDFNIIVLTSHYPGAKPYEELNGLKIYRYRYAPAYFEKLVYNGGITTNLKNHKFKWLLVPFFFISQFVSILKLVKHYPVSIIHAHWLIPQGFLALLAMKFTNKPLELLCTSHGGDLFGLNDALSIKLKQWVLKKSDAITVVSSAMLKKAIELVPEVKEKSSVVPMGTDLKYLFIPQKTINRSKNLLLFSGRLVEKKGVDTLLYAFAKIKKKCSGCQLVIIGDGPEKKKLQAISEKLNILQSIKFTGKLSHSELAIWYSKATIAVFPFKEAKNKDIEGFGLVMIEALGCECPVIVGNVPAVHDVIINNHTGILVESENIMDLTGNCLKLLENQKLAKKIGRQGRAHVLKNFDWHTSTLQYKEILMNLNLEQ
ncbi:MAG: glycosyltransferase family 4 protein [gamma proteobacterium symbiont of Lucinoma myriamae]|nr:glycosyltransferase family 4 protein [gamma proteobacterium symbiont of Lucinoma myriamae]MCU7818778.1 glycosyltransferase family 4 protein [gamma proteobacterium symbiont of Lucinoma myriamae]